MTDMNVTGLENLTVEELLVLIQMSESRLARFRERFQDRKEFEIKVTQCLDELTRQATKAMSIRHSPEQQQIDTHLMNLVEEIRILIGVQNKRYGLYNVAHGWSPTGRKRTKGNPNHVQAARVALTVIDYMGWDDK
jgi:hypothetical protein